MTGYWRKDDVPDSDSESVTGYWRKDDIPDSDSESVTRQEFLHVEVARDLLQDQFCVGCESVCAGALTV